MCTLCRTLTTLVLVVLCLCLAAGECFAVQASPHPIQTRQPDGTPITLFIRGTEYFNWQEDANGYSVLRTPQGAYVYAELGEDGQLRATGLQVGKVNPAISGLKKRTLPSAEAIRDIQMRSLPVDEPLTFKERVSLTAAAPPQGDVKNVVILMRFQNHLTRTLPSRADFDTIFNAVGGDPTLAPSGSVRDVYLENSYGALRLNSTVFAWVDLPETEQHYAAGVSAVGAGTRIRDAIKDALMAADSMINFSNFDDDGDGFVDAIAFVHSGYGAEWGGTDAAGTPHTDRIWSHRWVIPTWTSAEGVSVRDYHINPGLWSTSGTAPGRIGVISHETGHFFGLPDLYDTSGAGSGIGSWAMMANSWGFDGSQQYPPHFSAWSKIQLGWITPIDISAAGVYTVPLAEESAAKIYKISTNFASGEYLLVENRQPVGFDQKIPAGSAGTGGLAIWHVDEAKPANNDPGFPGQPGWPTNNKHYKIALLQADGNYDLEKGNNRGDAGDVFHNGFKDQLTSATTPSTHAYQGGVIKDTGIAITEISTTDAEMTFRLGAPDDEENGEGACCPTVASGRFRWSDLKEVSANDNILEVSIDLKRDSILHINANTSARAPAAAVNVRTGFSDQVSPNAIWTDSFRRIHLPGPNRSVNFGSNMALARDAGQHTIYWKLWPSGGTVRLDSGVMNVKAYPVKAGDGQAPSPAPGMVTTAASAPQFRETVDAKGEEVTVFITGNEDDLSIREPAIAN